jgi:chromatin structure-remodeling complex subunit RSC9
MASQRESSIPKSNESVEFLEKLQAFHDQRGTKLEVEPKVAGKYIDLLTLYNVVVSRGGYDRISDTKKAWGELAIELGCLPTPTTTGGFGFPLKTVFLKNLAAYEIVHIHGKEPPPKEILEDQTAKGGSLLTRTRENYRASRRGNADSEASGDDGTPARERNASEETPGSGGRVTRGLRQAPPQRVLFQPETHSSRSTRAAPTSHTSSPHPSQNHNHHQQQYSAPRGASAANKSSNPKDDNPIVDNYEPRPQMPLTLRPVITPGNNPTEFARRQKATKEAAATVKHEKSSVSTKGVILPGSMCLRFNTIETH